jgi:hypothetical protein
MRYHLLYTPVSQPLPAPDTSLTNRNLVEAWASQFFFEPAEIIPRVKDKFHSWVKCGTLRAALMSNIGLDVSRSTNYDLTNFRTWEATIIDQILQARARCAKGQEAVKALEHSHKVSYSLGGASHN